MKKFLLKGMFLVLALLLVACGSDNSSNGSSSSGGGQVVLKMSTLSADGTVIHEGFEKFAEAVERESNGEIKVELYANGQLANGDTQQFELVDSGSVHVLSVPTYTVAAAANMNSLNVFDLPFLFNDLDEMYSVLDSEVGDELKKQIEEKTNVVPIGFIDLGTFSIGNTKRPIEKPEDIQGLKIRSMNAKIHLDTVSKFGGTPAPIAYGEVFTALEQGTIDGLQTTTSLIYGDRLYEAINYLTVTRHVPLPHIMMINADFYEGLSEEHKEVIHKAAAEHQEFARQLSIDDEKVAIDTMKENGIEVVELTDEQKKPFLEKVSQIAEENMDILDEDFYNKVMDHLGR